MHTIWFNRTYSTNIHIIRLLRENPDCVPVRIIGTHADMSSPVLAACDVVEREPPDTVVGEAYLAWALDLCARLNVDVFVPRLHLDSIAAARLSFTSAGVSLVAGPAAAAALLEDKAAAFEHASAAGLAVPPYRVVRTGVDLLAAHAELSDEIGPDGHVCMKPVTGVGGEGFRVLTSLRPSLQDVLGRLTASVNSQDVATAMDIHVESGRVVPPVMVMPFLPGPEVSVDCLADERGDLLAAIPRTKMGRVRLLVEDPAAVEIARAVVALHRLSSLSNTQVRYWARPGHDATPRPYLLETNARISGGLHQTALSGLNLPWAAVQLALGKQVQLTTPRLGLAFTTVSTVVPIDRPRT